MKATNWKAKEDAEANCFMILDGKGTGNWIAHIRFNGEFMPVRQAEYAGAFAAAPQLLTALRDLFELHNHALKSSTNNTPRPTKEDIEDWYSRVERQAKAAISAAEVK